MIVRQQETVTQRMGSELYLWEENEYVLHLWLFYWGKSMWEAAVFLRLCSDACSILGDLGHMSVRLQAFTPCFQIFCHCVGVPCCPFQAQE